MKCRILAGIPNYFKEFIYESEFSDMDFLLLYLLQYFFPLIVLYMSTYNGINLEHVQYAIFQS